jgi:hypothetical protein
MMRTLPSLTTTVSQYVLSQLEARKEVVVEMALGDGA